MFRRSRLDPRIQEQIQRRVHRILRLVAWGGVVVYSATAVFLPWYSDGPNVMLLSAAMAGIALLHAAILPMVHTGWIQPRHANVTLCVLLLAGVYSTHLSADGMQADELAASYTLELIATALLVMSWRAYSAIAAAVAFDWTTHLDHMPFEDAANWSMVLGATVVLGALAHAVRLRGAIRVEGLLLESDRRRAKLEEALQELRVHQREAVTREKLSALGTLVAGVAHEINNPLTYMRGNVELSEMTLADAKRDRRGLTPSEQEELLRGQAAVLNGIDRIEHITRSLKHVARSTPSERRVANVNHLCDGVLVVAASHLGPDIEVIREYDARRPIRANEADISQVILNLVLNAADAMGSQGTLTLRTKDLPDTVAIEVEDSGPGVPPELRAKLFTPFFTTKPHGTGLGLSISHRIAEDHHGTLAYAEAKGHGACFRLTLPVDEAVPTGERTRVELRSAAPLDVHAHLRRPQGS